MYPVAPNSAVTLWNQMEPVVYLKQSDATGKPTLKVYDLVERSAEKPAVQGETKAEEYATKAELSAMAGVVRNFDELLGSLRSDIDTMKSDMYGIAGKKKTSKKADREGEDD